MAQEADEHEDLDAQSSDEPAQVLVVDDHELSRNAVIRLLRAADFSVVGAPSAIGATRLALRRGIQVAIIDLNMPAMRGSSLIEVLRKSPRLAHVGIVLLSGASDAELVMAAGEAGADAAISKVNMSETLVSTVQKLISRAARGAQQSARLSMPHHPNVKPPLPRAKRGA